MRKAVTVMLTGLALLGPTLAGSVVPTGDAAYARDGGFELTGKRLPTVDIDSDDELEDVRSQLDGLRTVDPGRYLSTLPGAPDQSRLAAIAKESASSLWVTLTTRVPTSQDYSDEIALAVGTDSGVECASTEVSLSNDDALYAGPVSIGVLVDPSTMSDSDDAAECMGAERLYVQVAHDPDDGNELPVEISVLEEPSVVATEKLPDEADSEDFEPSWPQQGRTSPTTGARSFADAPALAPGRYSDSVRTGDARLYRVDTGWGQHAQATVNLSPLSAGEAAQMGEAGLDVNMAILGPHRQPVAGDAEEASAESDVLLGARTPTVRYRNRESSDAGVGASALAGPYYVLVTATGSFRAPDLEVSYDLDLRVAGDEGGSPQYAGPAAPPNGALITDGASRTTERSAPDRAKAADSERQAERSAGWWPIFGPVAAGSLAAGIVLSVGAFLRRRRLRSATPPTG